jgi:hypothetical protein
MYESSSRKISRLGWAIIVVLPVMTGCGGSSATADAAGSTSGTAGASGGGSGGSSGSGGGGSSVPGTATVLFEQPQLSGITGNFVAPTAAHKAPPKGEFTMVLWQADRFQANGEPVPTAWDAGSQTGFTPTDAMGAQLGFRNLSGSSTAQMQDGTVGAYLNSQDLPLSTADQKMMITPQFIFSAGKQPVPFASAQSLLSGSLDAQVPMAVGSDTYVTADLLFEEVATGVRISYGVEIFHNGGNHPVVGAGYDSPSNTYMLNSPLGLDQTYVTLASGSAPWSGKTWTGLRHFEWSISQAQFVSGLKYLTTQFPGKVTSTDPSQYVLAEIHLNAEFHTQGQAAELGWSMQGMKLWTTP